MSKIETEHAATKSNMSRTVNVPTIRGEVVSGFMGLTALVVGVTLWLAARIETTILSIDHASCKALTLLG